MEGQDQVWVWVLPLGQSPSASAPAEGRRAGRGQVHLGAELGTELRPYSFLRTRKSWGRGRELPPGKPHTPGRDLSGSSMRLVHLMKSDFHFYVSR